MCAILVLSRKRDEAILIGDNVRVTVVDIRGDKVRLGIEAPTTIGVHRQEVYEAIQREHARAIHTNVKDHDITLASELIGGRLPVVGTNGETK